MKLRIYSFTSKGRNLALKVSGICGECAEISDEKYVSREVFETYDALVFIGAAGIAVRLTAPYVKDKLADPAVIVIDETGRFVIPILSGHVGGANGLSCELAEKLGAVPVITTATDVNGIMAVDEFAAKNGLKISGRDNIRKVSAGLLGGRPVNITFDDDVVITGSESDLDEKVLGLVYAPVIAGLGMRRGTDPDKLEAFFIETLNEHGLDPGDVDGIATIDIKKDEPAMLALAEKYRIPVFFFTAEELNAVDGDFDSSEFVMRTTGTPDVSGRAAKALGVRGRFILKKKKEDGMTISLFRKYRRVTFEY